MDLFMLFAASFVAATILPFPSELPLALSVRARDAWVVPVAVATAGNVLGACTTYWLARFAARRVTSPPPRMARAAQWISRYGAPALLLSWLPAIGDALVAIAGAAAMPFGRFVIWTLVGKAARYALVGWLTAASR